ncbi:hypothetical protein EYC84_004483 [Monilinia fructicola]|uniref:Uncharacterized protein n=1 Tax=Monilinia fructicola TaxID=38448 RepID=A0A5M9K0I1_MONFR|nr:hypothetical protein EYC84_004483 [Monilinia fructicola]
MQQKFPHIQYPAVPNPGVMNKEGTAKDFHHDIAYCFQNIAIQFAQSNKVHRKVLVGGMAKYRATHAPKRVHPSIYTYSTSTAFQPCAVCALDMQQNCMPTIWVICDPCLRYASMASSLTQPVRRARLTR